MHGQCDGPVEVDTSTRSADTADGRSAPLWYVSTIHELFIEFIFVTYLCLIVFLQADVCIHVFATLLL